MLANVSTLLHGGVSSLRIIGFKPFERQLFAQIFFVSRCAGLAAAFLACSFKDVA